jgi:hypothetical protein
VSGFPDSLVDVIEFVFVFEFCDGEFGAIEFFIGGTWDLGVGGWTKELDAVLGLGLTGDC